MPKVSLIAKSVLPTRLAGGDALFDLYAFRNLIDAHEHLVLSKSTIADGYGAVPLLRIHSECLTGDVFGSKRCDCGLQLERSLELIHADGNGLVIYLCGHEGRGIGLANKIRAYALQDQGIDTVDANVKLGFDADMRQYGPAASILRVLGIEKVRLLTNNPAKVTALEGAGIEIVQRIPLEVSADSHAHAYLATKKERMGHYLKCDAID